MSADMTEDKLTTYSGWLTEQEGKLETEWSKYLGFLQTLSADPKWSTYYNEIFGVNYISDAIKSYNQYRKMLGLPQIEVPETPTTTQYWKLPGRQKQGGSYFIPKTQPYLLHKGEIVNPAGRESYGEGGDINIKPITVNMNVYDMTDINKIGQKLNCFAEWYIERL
jgi:hypothetical protein